jgi:hypothetical protein
MRLLSATDVAIALAIKANTLIVKEPPTRFGDTCICFEDNVGLIEVHLTQEAANARLAQIKAALQ